MKIEIWNKAKSVEEEPLRLRLKQRGTNVVLLAVDACGIGRPAGNLLCIHADGSLYLSGHIDKELGLKLDGAGYLEVNHE